MSAVYRGRSVAELEHLYDSHRFVPEADAIIAETMRMSDAWRAEAPHRLDIAYGPTPRQTFDLYPAQGEGAPLLVFLHGGLWVRREKKDFGFLARPLRAAGAAVAVVEYDLCPTVTMDALVEEVRAATQFVWRNAGALGLDPDRLHVAGHSAGAHLALMLAATEWAERAPDLPADLVKSATAVSGIYDLEPLTHLRLNEQLRLDRAAARRNSPLHLAAPPGSMPVAILVGDEETPEFLRQAREMVHAWRTDEADVRAAELPGENHFTILRALGDPAHPATRIMLETAALA